jgi:hypothetical protein
VPRLQEDGYNGIIFRSVSNAWIKRVNILNSDTGLFVYLSTFVTVSAPRVGLQQSCTLPPRPSMLHALLAWSVT